MMAQHDMELIEDRFTAYLDETTRNALIPAHLNLMRSENIYRRFADFAFIEREV